MNKLANLVLEFTVERIFVGDAYGDVPLGLYVVRGENVVLVGQIVSPKRGILYFSCLVVVPASRISLQPLIVLSQTDFCD